MKKALKAIAGVFIVFFIIVGIILVVDISNDVEYKVIEEKKQPDSVYLRVETAETDKDKLETLTKDIKGDYQEIDAMWLWIYQDNSDKLLAKARIPYNDKGEAMVGADSSNYIFELE